MANFFSSSGADDQRPDSSHLGGGDDFFSFKDAPLFKSDEKSGGSFFGDSSSSVGGGDHGNFFKPSGASKNEGSFLDFDGSSTGLAEGSNSDVYLHPVALYKDPFRSKLPLKQRSEFFN